MKEIWNWIQVVFATVGGWLVMYWEDWMAFYMRFWPLL